MKHLRKEPKKRLPIIILSLVLILAVGAAAVLLIPQMTKNETNNTEPSSSESIASNLESTVTSEITESSESEPETSETVIETEKTKPVIRDYTLVELINGEVETPYTVIKYPEGLADHLVIANTSQNPYILEFYSVLENKPEIRLFDISLGDGSGGNMGTIKTAEGDIPLNVTIYTLPDDESWTDDEKATLYAMQDVINEILEQLEVKTDEAQSEVPVISDQPIDNGTINNIKIETPLCAVYYPSRFAETVYYTSDDLQKDIYKLYFYSKIDGTEDKLLFSVYFGGDEGEQIGAVMSSSNVPVPVYLIINEFSTDDLSDSQVELLYSMQEACNDLIERLPLLDEE